MRQYFSIQSHRLFSCRTILASREIAAHVVIEISPVIVFTSNEYDVHGKHTIVDHYTFKWKDGFALALGLGEQCS